MTKSRRTSFLNCYCFFIYLVAICNVHICDAFSGSHQHFREKIGLAPFTTDKFAQNKASFEPVASTVVKANPLSLWLPAAILLFTSQPVQAADFFTRANEQFQSSNNLVIPQNYDARKKTAMKQLIDLQNLQDERLDQCVDKGIDWEQCFMFGNSSSMTFADGQGNDWQKGLGIKIPVNKLRGPELPVPSPGSLLGEDNATQGTTPSQSRRPPTW